ncbi:spermidine synthase [Actinacidiphila acididurans]|uniref:Fused MFS/spermidine synthase n=1 Tax=Actinacidiphila acididurans TaxID=2784346 RepID=A0ABS2TZI5_9ACTN|nr:fused MFS/spermidine synthase [Actinacidiphila acididurans]MBM9508753.1 fused MFS/spermidine synthase [Actinacidiphila acididurans]
MARNRRGTPVRTAPVAGGTAALVPDPDRPRAWTLTVDGAPQSHVDLDDPGRLDFAYQRRLGHVIDLVAPPGRPLRALHLGGGGLTLARYLAHTRPRSTQQVVEADAALTELVRAELPWDRGWRIRVRAGDARETLAKLPEGWADLVIADVFSGARTPAHLTTAEFLAGVRRVLAPGGGYAANLTDGGALAFLRGQVATVLAAFTGAALVAEPAVLRGRRFGNAVLYAADGPLPLAELVRRAATDPASARVEHGPALAAFAAGARVVTDATAAASPEPPPRTFED